jgi:cell division protein FtsQ
MRIKKQIIRTGILSTVVVVLFAAIGFVEKKHGGKVCSKIIVNIENQYDTYFIDENDVIRLMTENGADVIIGRDFYELDLKKIEARVNSHKFVKNAEVYKDLKGNVIVDVEQWKPIARIIQQDGPDAYVGPEGQILPTSEKFTARVVLISGENTKELVTKDLNKTEEGKKLFEFLNYINEDPFLKAQIAEIQRLRNGEIILHTQVSRQYVEFGRPEEFDKKFKKLMIFYKDILPQKGWNKYEKVSVKYQNQIVCE